MKTKPRHHMLEEIYEQPTSIRQTLKNAERKVEGLTAELSSKDLNMVYITGSGSSYHASLIAQNVISSLTSLPVSAIPASELPSWTPSRYPENTAVIAISQSGESKDVITAVREAASRGGRVIGISNSKDSTLYRTADYSILTHAGLENAVTATKTFTAQLAVIYLLSFSLTDDKDITSTSIQQLHRTPNLISERLESLDDRLREVSMSLTGNNVFFLLGSGPNYAIAMEGALKLKEACNIFAEGFATREFLHGPLQLIRENTPVIVLSTAKDENIDTLVDGFSYYKTPVISISQKMISRKRYNIENILLDGDVDPILTPLVYIVPLQLLAYHSSILRGLNPDKPEKLTKVVSG